MKKLLSFYFGFLEYDWFIDFQSSKFKILAKIIKFGH